MLEQVGVVGALRRFPVKSMQGEDLEAVTVARHGVLGDRALAVVDRDSGEVVRGKTPDLGPRLLACRAAFAMVPEKGRELPPVAIHLPDGTRVCSDAADADDALSDYLGRPVTLASAAPAQSAFVGGRADFLEQVDLPAFIDARSLLDAMPVSVLTTSTLEQLSGVRPETRFDQRRFRMNVVVGTSPQGFLENEWPGGVLRVGDAVRLRVAIPTPRCVLTTMVQEDLPRDPAVLRTVARANTVKVAGRTYPCVGAYAGVEVVGEITTGDPVWLDRPREEDP